MRYTIRRRENCYYENLQNVRPFFSVTNYDARRSFSNRKYRNYYDAGDGYCYRAIDRIHFQFNNGQHDELSAVIETARYTLSRQRKSRE